MWLEIAVIGAVSFASGLITGFGRWALAASMQVLIAMVLALVLPQMDVYGILSTLARMVSAAPRSWRSRW